MKFIKILLPILLISSMAWGAAKLQNADFVTEAYLVGAGGSASQLLNDTKIWSSVLGKTLDDAITDGDLGPSGASFPAFDWDFAVSSGTDLTTLFNVNLTNAATATTTTFNFFQTANRAISIPNANTTLVGTDTVDFLTNKTISLASNSILTTIPSTAAFFDAAGLLSPVAYLPAFNLLSPLTTKGDLLTWFGGTNAALPVGADNFVLAADSTQASGLRWQATGGGVTNVTATGPLSSTGGATPNIAITQAGVATDGYLSSVDWNTFNNKISTITVSAPLSITGGINPNIAITQSGTATDGYLSSVDWNIFNNKQTTGNFITNLFGDATADGPGNVYITVNSVGGASAASVASASLAVANASSLNIANTLVTRDATGSFYAQDITATFHGDLIGNVTGNVSGTASNVTGVVAITNGGTGQITAVTAFNALSPLTTKGDILTNDGTDDVRFAVCPNGQSMQADSSTLTGWICAAPSTGTVTAVTATGPLSSTGGATPNIAITQAGVATDGYLSSVDWNTFNNKLTTFGVIGIANGGTGQTTAVTAFNALSPLTTLGDTLYHNGTDDVRLAGNITAVKQFLSQTGTGAVSAAPIWAALVAGDIPALPYLSTTLIDGHIFVGNAANIATDVAVNGDVTISNTGTVTLITSGVVAGTYTNTTVTVNAKGIVTGISTGSSSGGSGTPMTTQKFIGGSGTYTRPTSPTPIYLRVTMMGGGGGGGSGNFSTPASGNTGINTTFGLLLVAFGGPGGSSTEGSAAASGNVTITAPATGLPLKNGAGGLGSTIVGGLAYGGGGDGCGSPYGGRGIGSPTSSVANAGTYGGQAAPNSGAGGGGGQGSVTTNGGNGGGCGGYITAVIPSPASTYSYTVGNFGAGGCNSGAASCGGDGGTGFIYIEEFYQ